MAHWWAASCWRVARLLIENLTLEAHTVDKTRGGVNVVEAVILQSCGVIVGIQSMKLVLLAAPLLCGH